MKEKKERNFTRWNRYLMNGERQIDKNIGGIRNKIGEGTWLNRGSRFVMENPLPALESVLFRLLSLGTGGKCQLKTNDDGGKGPAGFKGDDVRKFEKIKSLFWHCKTLVSGGNDCLLKDKSQRLLMISANMSPSTCVSKETRRSKRMCPRVIFNPGVGPDRYWTNNCTNPSARKYLKTNGMISTRNQEILVTDLKSMAEEQDVHCTQVATNNKVGSLKPAAFTSDRVKPGIHKGGNVNPMKKEGPAVVKKEETPNMIPKRRTGTVEEDSDATVALPDDDDLSVPMKIEVNGSVNANETPFITPTAGRNETEEEGSDTMAVPGDDDLSMNTGSPRPSPTVRSLLAKTSPRWISGSIQTLIMNSIDWGDLKQVIKDDIVAIIDQESMRKEIKQTIKDGLVEKNGVSTIDPRNIPTGLRLGDLVDKKQVNEIVSLVAKKALFKSICFKGLERQMVEHFMYAIDFEGLKAKAIEKILRNGAPVSQLEGLMRSVGDDMDV